MTRDEFNRRVHQNDWKGASIRIAGVPCTVIARHINTYWTIHHGGTGIYTLIAEDVLLRCLCVEYQNEVEGFKSQVDQQERSIERLLGLLKDVDEMAPQLIPSSRTDLAGRTISTALALAINNIRSRLSEDAE